MSARFRQIERAAAPTALPGRTQTHRRARHAFHVVLDMPNITRVKHHASRALWGGAKVQRGRANVIDANPGSTQPPKPRQAAAIVPRAGRSRATNRRRALHAPEGGIKPARGRSSARRVSRVHLRTLMEAPVVPHGACPPGRKHCQSPNDRFYTARPERWPKVSDQRVAACARAGGFKARPAASCVRRRLSLAQLPRRAQRASLSCSGILGVTKGSINLARGKARA